MFDLFPLWPAPVTSFQPWSTCTHKLEPRQSKQVVQMRVFINVCSHRICTRVQAHLHNILFLWKSICKNECMWACFWVWWTVSVRMCVWVSEWEADYLSTDSQHSQTESFWPLPVKALVFSFIIWQGNMSTCSCIFCIVLLVLLLVWALH